MRIKLDENLSTLSVAPLRGCGHDVDTVMSEGLAGAPDDRVFAGAQSDRRLLVTCDLDFSDLRRFVRGAHAGIVRLRLAEPSRAALEARVAEVLAHREAETWEGCLVVATDDRIRVVRPADG